ncbi:unnamed protein product [Pedinophyceae sp. YPF-701]|nr:unnamed protein product [Pedinophyceae sp. YPF-701]
MGGCQSKSKVVEDAVTVGRPMSSRTSANEAHPNVMQAASVHTGSAKRSHVSRSAVRQMRNAGESKSVSIAFVERTRMAATSSHGKPARSDVKRSGPSATSGRFNPNAMRAQLKKKESKRDQSFSRERAQRHRSFATQSRKVAPGVEQLIYVQAGAGSQHGIEKAIGGQSGNSRWHDVQRWDVGGDEHGPSSNVQGEPAGLLFAGPRSTSMADYKQASMNARMYDEARKKHGAQLARTRTVKAKT